jgi:hypothetical protein
VWGGGCNRARACMHMRMQDFLHYDTAPLLDHHPHARLSRTVDFLFLELVVFNGANQHRGTVGQHEASRNQPFVPAKKYARQHRFVKQSVAHPLAARARIGGWVWRGVGLEWHGVVSV